MLKRVQVFIAICDGCKKEFKTDKQSMFYDPTDLVEAIEDNGWIFIDGVIRCVDCKDSKENEG